MTRVYLLALCLLLPPAAAFSQSPRSQSASPAGDLELWAFRYGTSRMTEKAVFRGGSGTRSVEFAWLFYALRLGGRWFLIDTGFDDPAMVKYYNVAWVDPMELLKEAGIKAADVSFVILTHSHFDHIGLADRFPSARVIMSEAARRDAAAHAAPPRLRSFFTSSRRIDTFKKRITIEGRITLVEIGGHAPGSCVVRLDGEKIVFTGDEAYLPENWTASRPNGSIINADKNAAFIESLKLISADHLILTAHDPALTPIDQPVRRLR